jgi:hypothetical protein
VTQHMEWQRRQQHEKDINETLTRLRFRDAQGRIRMFIGALFYPDAKKTGHTSMGFDTCACKTAMTVRIDDDCWSDK